jgi:hypothetical protein
MTHFFSKQFCMRMVLVSMFALALVFSVSSVDAQTIYNTSFSSLNFFYGDYSSGSSGSSGDSGGAYYAPSVSITAQPLSVNSGDSTTLTWSGTDLSTCTASGGWSGVKSVNGSESTGAVVNNTTYTLTCDGFDGSVVDASVTVTISSVTVPPTNSTPAPTVSLTASPATVNYGEGTTLYWVSTDASSCEASGSWGGDRPLSGSFTIGALYSQATYTLTCINLSGSTDSSVTVNVNPVGIVDNPPIGVLDSATCSTVNGWAYDPDTSPTTTYVPPSTSATACWQTPSAVVIDGYTRCQQSGACTAGGTADSKCLDADGNMEQPAGLDYCIEVSSLDDADCNRPVPYTPTTNTTLSCVVGFNEPAVALGISNHQGEGTRILGNQSSANFACQQLGYNSANSFQTKSFSSCGDNQLAYDGGGFWAYGDACVLGNSGISYVQCVGTGAICENKCGNGVIDPGEQCDGNSSTNYDRCAEPTWYCSSTCTIISNSIGDMQQCP